MVMKLAWEGPSRIHTSHSSFRQVLRPREGQGLVQVTQQVSCRARTSPRAPDSQPRTLSTAPTATHGAGSSGRHQRRLPEAGMLGTLTRGIPLAGGTDGRHEVLYQEGTCPLCNLG